MSTTEWLNNKWIQPEQEEQIDLWYSFLCLKIPEHFHHRHVAGINVPDLQLIVEHELNNGSNNVMHRYQQSESRLGWTNIQRQSIESDAVHSGTGLWMTLSKSEIYGRWTSQFPNLSHSVPRDSLFISGRMEQSVAIHWGSSSGTWHLSRRQSNMHLTLMNMDLVLRNATTRGTHPGRCPAQWGILSKDDRNTRASMLASVLFSISCDIAETARCKQAGRSISLYVSGRRSLKQGSGELELSP